MNLLVSYNWLKEFVAIKQSPEKVAELLSLHALSAERLYHIAKQMDKMVIGKVVKTEKHPNADKLSLNQVDVGGKTVQIVCGAPNVHAGMLVAVALPGARVRWHGEGDLVTLSATKIRGIESFGMMCAANEIGLEKYPDAAKGIIDLSWLQYTENGSLDSRDPFSGVRPGMSLVKALDMDDVLMDVEVTSNRPDAMSIVGVAREVAAVLNAKLSLPTSPQPSPTRRGSKGEVPISLSVDIRAKKLCTRFAAIAIDGVKVGPSPWWIQKRLFMAGLRPINNIVDITNYVMLEQGKPLHAFDADKITESLNHGITESHIIVRTAQKGESLKALDGRIYPLTESMLVVADAQRSLAIAGVMGGEATGVTEKTKTIIFESAVFDPVSIRHTARALNLHSEASNLFEKGLSDESVLPALARAVELTLEIAGGQVASKLVDTRTQKHRITRIILKSKTIERMLGITLSVKDVVRYLTALGFNIEATSKKQRARSWRVTAPWWRHHDVTIEADLVEEIARFYGYHHLPSKLPDGPLATQDATDKKIFFWERRVKELLRGAGYTETMSYSFTSEAAIQKLGLDPAQSIRIVNPLTDDHAYLRPRPIAALLEIVSANQNDRDHIHIFELARMFRPRVGKLPDEPLRLAGAVVSADVFREAKGTVELFLHGMGIASQRISFPEYMEDEFAPWVDTRRSVRIMIDNEKFGSVIMLTEKARKNFDLKQDVALFRIRFEELTALATTTHGYTPLPKYPPVLRDLAFIVPKTVTYAAIDAVLRKQALVTSVELFDLYEGEKIGADKKSLAFHVTYQSPERTLTIAEVDVVQEAMIKELEKKFGAQLRDF
ncbi:phenylalanine--tRNA ligase subunit beta [Candidatus Uhrbacteria bacterium]|nr:phenylalanine--tRNA ligase subunit beta [Candidatus Uhrbacteria bacterium]